MRLSHWLRSVGLGAAGALALCGAAQAAPDDNPAPGRPHPHRAKHGSPGEDGAARKPANESQRHHGGASNRRGGPADPQSAPSGHPGSSAMASAHPPPAHHEAAADPKVRRENRKRHLQELRGRWGDSTLKLPACQEELKRHAWRMARLKRMRELATEKKNDAQLAKLDALEKRELARHERAMAQQRTASAAPPAASSAVPQLPKGKP